MRLTLIVLFGAMLLALLALVVVASLDRSVWNLRPELLADPWFHMTAGDAYAGLITFYVWVAYKESTWAGRVFWFLAVMLLGGIGMALYMLILLAGLPKDATVEQLLLRKPVGAPKTSEAG